MNEKQLKMIIHQIAKQAIPETRDPLPGIQAQIHAAGLFKETENARRFHLLPSQAIVLIGLILAAVFLVTPQGRTLAQEIIEFFSRSEGETIPLSQQQATAFSQVPTPEPTYLMSLSTVAPDRSSPVTDLDKIAAQISGCSQQFWSYPCQAAAVEQQTGYDLKGFSVMPSGYTFSKFNLVAQEKMVMTIYESIEGDGWLVLYQGKGSNPQFIKSSEWEKVPADKIETVKIGNLPGEYVRGMFAVKAGSGEMTWMDDGWMQRIGWQSGDSWFMVEENNSPMALSYLDKDRLLQVAESLVEVQNVAMPTPDPQHLNSISQVEELADFSVLEPGILPEDFKFDCARYDSRWKSVLLFYQGRSGLLIIKQTNNEGYILRDITKSYPAVQKVIVRNQPGVYASHRDNPSPVLWFEEGENVLFWREGDLTVQIIYRPNDIFGGQMGASELAAIGNSLKE